MGPRNKLENQGCKTGHLLCFESKLEGGVEGNNPNCEDSELEIEMHSYHSQLIGSA
jgi:hypothetical protein